MRVLLSSTKKSSQGSLTPNTARSSIRVPRSATGHPCLTTSMRRAYTISHPRFYSGTSHITAQQTNQE